jgi:6-phosphogluconolactonase
MDRSDFFRRIGIGALGITALKTDAIGLASPTEFRSEFFHVGCYTAGPEEGILTGRFDPATGLAAISLTNPGITNPSFLIYGKSGMFIYAAIETDDFGGKSSGAVSAFRTDPQTGKLTLLNTVASQGAHPCHLCADSTGKYVLAANYTGGNVAVLPVLGDGQLGEAVDVVRHTGSGPNKARQESPHAHSVNLSPDNRFAFVCDLGIDKIMIYRFDDSTGKLTPADTPFFTTAPGAGPRHFTFSRDGRHAVVVNELDSTLTWMRYDADKGLLTEIITLTTLPGNFSGENSCADVHYHPTGDFIYASNRGHNSIAVFTFDFVSEKIKRIQNQSVMGKTPRNFAIHGTGRHLLAANEDSDSITLFELDPVSGMLAATGKKVNAGKPVCLLFRTHDI